MLKAIFIGLKQKLLDLDIILWPMFVDKELRGIVQNNIKKKLKLCFVYLKYTIAIYIAIVQWILRKIKIISNKKLKLCFVYLANLDRIHGEHQYS